MKRLVPGERLEIVGDDPAMTIDMPAWCDDDGHELLECARVGLRVRCLVRKGEKPARPGA